VIGSLSRRERWLIGAAVLTGVVVLGWELVVEPVRERYRAAAELVPVREQLLARRQELVARRPAIAAELESANRQLEALSTRFLPGATPAVAASELQKLVKDMAGQAGTEVRSERILPTVERGDLVEVPIEIAVSGEIRQLVDLLARLDRAPLLLAVQDVKIRVVNISQPRELLATLTLSGFILPAKARA
jgi:Tfp pilus assembly protein PilO